MSNNHRQQIEWLTVLLATVTFVSLVSLYVLWEPATGTFAIVVGNQRKLDDIKPEEANSTAPSFEGIVKEEHSSPFMPTPNSVTLNLGYAC